MRDWGRTRVEPGWEHCGSATLALWEHCGSATLALWEYCGSATLVLRQYRFTSQVLFGSAAAGFWNQLYQANNYEHLQIPTDWSDDEFGRRHVSPHVRAGGRGCTRVHTGA